MLIELERFRLWSRTPTLKCSGLEPNLSVVQMPPQIKVENLALHRFASMHWYVNADIILETLIVSCERIVINIYLTFLQRLGIVHGKNTIIGRKLY